MTTTVTPAPEPVPAPSSQPEAPAPTPPEARPAAPESLLAPTPAEPATPEAPEAYEAFTLPEGASLDAEQLAEASALFRSVALSQEQAQKFVDLALARDARLAERAAEQGAKAFVELQNRWVAEVKADPEIGGGRLEPSLALARRAIDRLDVPGLGAALDLTGAGNHPAVVKAFVRLGQMMAENRFRPGDAVPPAPRSLAEVIYDGQPSTKE